MIKVGLYNMQRASMFSWDVVNSINNGKTCDVMCLQECGPSPRWDRLIEDRADLKIGIYKKIKMAHLSYGAGSNRACSTAIMVPNADIEITEWGAIDPKDMANRRLLWGKVKDQTTPGILVGSVHAPSANESRVTVEYVHDVLSKVRRAYSRWIVAGDYNYEYDRVENLLLGMVGSSKVNHAGPTKTGTVSQATHMGGKSLDYIMTNGVGECLEVGKVGSSDHAPAIYEIRFD